MKKSEDVIRGLMVVWADFDTILDTVPFVDKINRGKFRVEDYKKMLINHRQQVVEGARWIARAASSVDSNYLDQRSTFLKHAITEHKDYRMLEDSYVSLGGTLEEIRGAEKNIGSEALHSYMYDQASHPNPFNLLGAMFIIEGLGQKKAGVWGTAIRNQLCLTEKQVNFLVYHAANDDDHMAEFEKTLQSGILEIPGMGEKIIKTAKVTARLYRLQMEEMGNV
jgi:3-oxoacyl-[acyl-carrier-protein] synthase III